MTRRLMICLVTGALAASGVALGAKSPGRLLGAPATLGDGTVTSFAELDGKGAPRAVGVEISAAAMAVLPTAPSDGHHCVDANKDGTIDLATECAAWHERILPIPTELSRRADMPFKWVLFNWNPRGHMPPGVFDVPHFDIHYYIEPIENIFALERGDCGPEFTRCDQYAVACKPVPSNYLPANYLDLGIVAPAMGKHLIDPMNHNFHGEPFQRHWVYGTWDGRVAFWEEMTARSYLLTKPSTCYPIQVPEAVAIAGYYPTQSCIRYLPGRDVYAISVEGFVSRPASPPGPLREARKAAP